MEFTKKTGSILGWMIGDALGTTVEFNDSKTAKSTIEKLNEFKDGLHGGGAFGLAPGQFTDDTEMGLAVMSVIIKNGYYNQNEVAYAYHKWYQSKPFDIGTTTYNSVIKTNAADMISVAKTINSKSLSNGFLMRMPGLVTMYPNQISDGWSAAMNAIALDIQLTHGHPEALHIGLIYGGMLYRAILGENANDIYSYGKEKSINSPLLAAIYQAVETNSDVIIYSDIKYIFNNIDKNCMGFVGFAFWLLLKSLKKYNSYQDAMLYVIGHGGDADTNGCIVGAIMGALYPNTIPQKWIDSLVNCETPRHKQYPLANPNTWLRWIK